jgi:predicted transcriptional regulator
MLHVKHGKTRRISVPLAPEEIGALQEIADSHERSLSWVAARAIRHYLADSQKESRAVAASASPGTEPLPK